MVGWNKRRTWEKVFVRGSGSSFCIFLDKQQIKTPLGNLLCVPTKKLAYALASEWKAQKNEIVFNDMRLNKLVNSSLDQVKGSRQSVIDSLLEYGDTDLLCYRAEEPPDLRLLQVKQWGPVLDWLQTNLDINLEVFFGVRYVPQRKNQLQRFEVVLASYSHYELAALRELVTISGSLVLALALKSRALGFKDAWNKAVLEETWQMKKWGKDQESLDRLQKRRHDFKVAHDFLTLLG